MSKAKGGRPAYEPNDLDRKRVTTMATMGISVADIGKVIGNQATGKALDKKTLYKYYRAELESGHIQANANVAGNLYTIATGSTPQAVTAAIFWLKTRAGWTDKAPEAPGQEDTPMPTEIIIRGVKPKPRADDGED